MALATQKQKNTVTDDRRQRYFRRTRGVTWSLAVVFALSVAGTPNGNLSTESFRNFGYAMAVLFFLWGLDAHVRIRRLR